MNKWIAIALLVAGCKQGLGDHCQTNKDCTDGICSMTKHVCVTSGTSSDDEIDAPVEAPTFRSFMFLASVNTGLTMDVVATITGMSITATVPAGTVVTQLIATFDSNGIVTVRGTPQISGNVANDFRTPVVFTVTGQDGTTRDFTVTVTVAR